MESGNSRRMIQVLVGEEIFQDGTLPPLYVGDVIDVVLGLVSRPDPSEPGVNTHRVTVQPDFGKAPWADRDGTLRWPFAVSGDGWSATWRHHSPVSGRASITGYLTPDFVHAVRGRPGVVTGRVRRLQLLEQRLESTPRGSHYVEGTGLLRDLGSSRDRYWPDWHLIRTDQSGTVARGVVVDLDLDDVPELPWRFDADAVATCGTDVWVLDRSAPVLLHLDRSHDPVLVTEYLLPVPFEPPGNGRTSGTLRIVHADADGCWISCPDEIVRCDRSGPADLTVRRVSMDGGEFTVHLDGRLFVVTQPYPSLRGHDRYGWHRFDPSDHPFRELVDGALIPVDDEATIQRVWARSSRPDQAEAPDGTTWIGHGDLTARAPDGTERRIDLDHRTVGRVHWVRPEPLDDPANADLMLPTPWYPTGPSNDDG